ncbi:LPS assembly lipoprotein LptE [Candidatus Protochlamydia phocaeensis]|uniref:LPS assembly lipoprotein LptE n=1 Tax=Candidatus Protochlamydia phocaeensis TaxID=1414722 RepID=UPI001896A037|nr:LPS assembly lipoprotein LptE [Candidatus Protochlamydia phocaeensis]
MSKSARVLVSLLLLGGLIGFNSCQYRFGRGELAEQYSTICVPYIEGDTEGELTAEVIKRLSLSGGLRYVSSGGDLILSVKIIEMRDENIGFRYDRKKHGELKRSIIPTETRLSALVEVSVKEAGSGQIIRGPTRLTGSVDFDHEYYYSSHHALNIFSLGQLNDIDAAHDAAMHPLNRHLAERIADYVLNSW